MNKIQDMTDEELITARQEAERALIDAELQALLHSNDMEALRLAVSALELNRDAAKYRSYLDDPECQVVYYTADEIAGMEAEAEQKFIAALERVRNQ